MNLRHALISTTAGVAMMIAAVAASDKANAQPASLCAGDWSSDLSLLQKDFKGLGYIGPSTEHQNQLAFTCAMYNLVALEITSVGDFQKLTFDYAGKGNVQIPDIDPDLVRQYPSEAARAKAFTQRLQQTMDQALASLPKDEQARAAELHRRVNYLNEQFVKLQQKLKTAADGGHGASPEAVRQELRNLRRDVKKQFGLQ